MEFMMPALAAEHPEASQVRCNRRIIEPQGFDPGVFDSQGFQPQGFEPHGFVSEGRKLDSSVAPDREVCEGACSHACAYDHHLPAPSYSSCLGILLQS